MTDPGRREPGAQGFDDPTRDIRLPRPPGSPPLVVRPEWSTYADQPAAPAGAAAQTEVAAGKPPRLTDQPTDELPEPPVRRREPTLKFDNGAGFPRPAPTPVPQAAPARSRKAPWVLLALLPLVVIVGSGIWLLVLLSHG